MKIGLGDLVFYTSSIAGLLTLFVKLTTNLIPANVASWIGVISIMLSAIAFIFWERLNGTTPPPQNPGV